MSWEARAAAEREKLRAMDRWRRMRVFDSSGPEGLLRDGSRAVSFASNDYLGLTTDRRVIDAAHEAIDRWGTGSSASRLVTGTRSLHFELEAELTSWKAAERALLFPTGFATNLGVLGALGGLGDRILSDELNHASIVDGCRMSRCEVAAYRHGDVDHLRDLLRLGGRAIVVTDTVFSMDGDLAPLDDLMEACAEYGALLVLDEAHSVLGPEPDLGNAEVLRVGTLSKQLGSLGGFVAGSTALVELVLNRARSFIFTTAPTPGDTAAALAALRIVRSTEGDTLRRRLLSNIDRVRSGHPSPIIPILIGSESNALMVSERLLARGILVPAIRPPTVPAGTSRLRIAMSAAHSNDQIDLLLNVLGECSAIS